MTTSKPCTILFAVAVLVLNLPSTGFATVVFSDDFESGNLDQWTIGGRQLAGVNTADVVVHNGSEAGHLYKTSFTEITFATLFEYDPLLSFYFDMEVNATSTTPPSGAYYGSSGVDFRFLDADGNALGQVSYLYATTSYLADLLNPRPEREVIGVTNGVMESYSLGIGEILSLIEIDETALSSVEAQFRTYSSTYPNPVVTAELWLDDFCVDIAGGCIPQEYPGVDEPPTVLLLLTGLGAGLVAASRRRSRKVRPVA